MGILTNVFNPNQEEEWIDFNKKEIEPVMDEAADHLIKNGIPASYISKTVLPKEISRAEAIVRKAEKEGIGTIIVGRRGLTIVEEFFLGRVSTKILQMANKMAVWVV